MPAGPLDDARLKAIEAALNASRLDDAQRRLAGLGATEGLGPGVAYLSARLLFHRGRLDAPSVAARVRDVLRESPDFVEARAWLDAVEQGRAVTQPPPRLETPRVPEPDSERVPEPESLRIPEPIPTLVDFGPTPGVITLGPLEPPKSELPTEPAPPLNPDSSPEPFHLATGSVKPSIWDPLEAELVSGHRDAVAAGLDKLCSQELDALLARQKPKLEELAGAVARFLSRAPVTQGFAPFDLSLESLDRLDAVIALLVPPGISTGLYAFRIFLAVYLGECVREAKGGVWQGTLTEPESIAVRSSDESFVPWQKVGRALAEGHSLRKGAGPPPHPGAEPPERGTVIEADTPTPWDPAPWPKLEQMKDVGRALSASVLGVWAARCLKIPLDRSPASLVALDRYVTLLSPPGSTASAGAWTRRAAVLSGSYLGELLCLHGAGRWSENDAAPDGPLRFEVLLPDGRAVYPVLFAYERLTGKTRGTFGQAFTSALGR